MARSKDLADTYTRKAKGIVRTEYLAIITGSLEFYSETGSNVYHLPDVTLFRETLYERNNRNQDHQLFNETFIHTRRGNMGQSITKDEREREARNVSPTFPLEIFSTKIVDYIQGLSTPSSFGRDSFVQRSVRFAINFENVSSGVETPLSNVVVVMVIL